MVVGIVGTVATLYSANQHEEQESIRAQTSATQESNRAQTSFTRAQQVQTYTAFLNAVNGFVDAALYKYYHTIAPGHGNVVVFAAPQHDLPTSWLIFGNAATGLAFSSSGDVMNRLGHLVDAMDNYYDMLVNWDVHHPPGSPATTDDDFAAFKGQQRQTLMDLYKAENDFSNAARNDFGLAPLPVLPHVIPG